ncbi:MAG: von Willebrand factor type A domain-containing protein [Lachnospiraceae bacterium]|nr:von Willebrand factor type A domain-containing protein [Lachnospiraceae bacterium]
MMKIEQMIREKGKEDFYNYYLGLGYDQKTAAVLSLFTYGKYRYTDLTMDAIYEAVCKGEEYLPKRVRQERERMSRRTGFSGGLKLGRAMSLSAPALGAGAAMKETMFCASRVPAENGAMAMMSMAAMPMAAMPMEDSDEMADICCGSNMIFEDEECATDEYETIEEKDARGTAAEPTSTFRMTTNTASAGVILNQLRNGRRIDKSMVRIEEMLNYFRYESKIPDATSGDMFNIAYELMDADHDKKYLYINVQGKMEVRDRQNIIILLDVSGSMSGNTQQTQAMIATIISKLGNGDKLSLVTYSDEDIVELEAVTINGEQDRIHALEKLLSIEITGCTNGSKGIDKAYKIGKKNYIEGGNNQVILITDGDLNFGITDKGGLEELIEQKKKDNLFLSVIGTGLYNYKDDKLEVLCKHGNGVYRTVNNLADVKKSIDEEYASLVNIIAKDVKAQVEFNPEVVQSYRLPGFENRALTREDFANDKVISEPFGSGGYGVALYELTMKTDDAPADSGLKYSRLVTTGSQEPGTVKIRFKEPLADTSHELEKVIERSDESFTDNLRLAFVVYVCAEKLRASNKIGADEIDLAKRLYKELGSSIREKNAADLFKLAGILEKSEQELGIGIPDGPFPW